jgi:lysosomal alpha-mannosidase
MIILFEKITIEIVRKEIPYKKASIVFNEWVSQKFNLYRGSSTIELQWIVGTITINYYIGKQIIIRYNTYTDDNGRQVLQRIRDYRLTWYYGSSSNTAQRFNGCW